MLKFTCDNCGFETDNYKVSKHNQEVIPVFWISLTNATFQQDRPDCKGYIYAGKANLHFCGRMCFIEKMVGLPPQPKSDDKSNSEPDQN